ncbi:hypothetical protein ACFQX6_59550 [Streptosporangium lutulentum]
MAFSGDGRRLAIQTGGRSPRLTVWDTVTFRRIAAVAIRRDARALAVAINTDGSAVASYANHQDARRPLPGRGRSGYGTYPAGVCAGHGLRNPSPVRCSARTARLSRPSGEINGCWTR